MSRFKYDFIAFLFCEFYNYCSLLISYNIYWLYGYTKIQMTNLSESPILDFIGTWNTKICYTGRVKMYLHIKTLEDKALSKRK